MGGKPSGSSSGGSGGSGGTGAKLGFYGSGMFGPTDEELGISTLKAGKLNGSLLAFANPSVAKAAKAGLNFVIQGVDAAALAQEKAAEKAAKWQAALQGIALVAGVVGGKLGETLQVVGNIGDTFAKIDWSKASGKDKFNAIAGSVGQIGGLVGGKAGAAMQGAAGGAMTGLAIGGPVGAVAGGVIGGIMGLFGHSKQKKEEEKKAREEFEKLTTAIKEQYGTLDMATRHAEKYGVNLKKALDSKNAKELDKALAEVEKRMKGLETATQGVIDLIANLTYTDAAGNILSTFDDPDVARAAGSTFSTVFWEVYSKEGAAALDKLRPAWDKLLEDLKAQGVDPVALGLGRVGQLMDATKDPKTKALLGASAAGTSILKGSMNGGFMSAGLLKDQTTVARATLDELKTQGLDANAMAEQLAALAQAYKATGEEMPEDLKKAMEEAGIQTLERHTDLLTDIRNILRDGVFSGGDGESRALGRRGRYLDRDTTILAHQGEIVEIIPAHEARRMQTKHMARGTYDTDDLWLERQQARQEARDIYLESQQAAPVTGSTSSGTTTSSDGGGSSAATVVEAVKKSVAQAQSIAVNNAPSITIVDQSAVKTAEGQRAFGRYVVSEVERALDQNSRGLKTRIETIARQAAQR